MFNPFKQWFGKIRQPATATPKPPLVLPDLQANFELLRTPGSKLLETWERHRHTPGILPVMLGSHDDLLEEGCNLKLQPEAYQQIQQGSLKMDVDQWIAQQREEEDQLLKAYGKSRAVVDWSVTQGDGELRPFSCVAHNQEVIVGLLPVEHPWLAAARLDYGGWNACPNAHVHTAFLKRWHERYGATIASLAYDYVEFHVANPPASDEACKKLAIEQYAYCADVIDQGHETMGNLAQSLKGSSWWYFWWD